MFSSDAPDEVRTLQLAFTRDFAAEELKPAQARCLLLHKPQALEMLRGTLAFIRSEQWMR